MNARTEFQTIKGADGLPAFVVVPYADFLKLYVKEEGLIPHEVLSAAVDGVTPVKAWREHLGFTQAEVAARLNVTQTAFAQLETSAHPRKSSLHRIANALGLTFEQLDF
ncbi:MAG: helix-turn-helix transcriptional regulator [Sulfuricellaceae bacterium]